MFKRPKRTIEARASVLHACKLSTKLEPLIYSIQFYMHSRSSAQRQFCCEILSYLKSFEIQKQILFYKRIFLWYDNFRCIKELQWIKTHKRILYAHYKILNLVRWNIFEIQMIGYDAMQIFLLVLVALRIFRRVGYERRRATNV